MAYSEGFSTLIHWTVQAQHRLVPHLLSVVCLTVDIVCLTVLLISVCLGACKRHCVCICLYSGVWFRYRIARSKFFGKIVLNHLKKRHTRYHGHVQLERDLNVTKSTTKIQTMACNRPQGLRV